MLINSPHCTLIKLPVIGPAPTFPPRAHQDGSVRKQLEIYGAAVTAPRPPPLHTAERRRAEARNPNRTSLRALMWKCLWSCSRFLYLSDICDLPAPPGTKCNLSQRAQRYGGSPPLRRGAAINRSVGLFCFQITTPANLSQHQHTSSREKRVCGS